MFRYWYVPLTIIIGVTLQHEIAAWIVSSRFSRCRESYGPIRNERFRNKFSLSPLRSTSNIYNYDDDSKNQTSGSIGESVIEPQASKRRRTVLIIGAGWGGLSAAHALSKARNDLDITIVEASSRVGGLVQDGYKTISGSRIAEAGMHGFWNNYHNIYHLLRNEIDGFNIDTALTDYAEQGQYSPNGLQAIWPIYRDQPVQLPTGLAQAIYARFLNLPLLDLLSAFPLVLAFADFDDSEKAWERYDCVSFRDLCRQFGVSERCYDEAFEPMILTGLFAPGAECSAAAAMGMAYFFVLQSQTAFDVQWCRGNIGSVIFDPWIKSLKSAGVHIETDTRVTDFQFSELNSFSEAKTVTEVICTSTLDGTEKIKKVDEVIFAVGAKALNAFIRYCPTLAQFSEFRRFANLRGTSVLATRVFLDSNVTVPYSANACWGFDRGIGMTMFDVRAIHGPTAPSVYLSQGSVLEVDYYHASSLLTLPDDDIVAKVKSDLDTILGPSCKAAKVIDAAIIRLPDSVNWYFPGSYTLMPDVDSKEISNVYFAGDIAHTRHGSWSQEKAFVTGVEAANLVLRRPRDYGIISFANDEPHVKFGRSFVASFRSLKSQKMKMNNY
jgi:uncharacterized protein with NAD-binding domain and iron-sulfur cluster